MKLLERLGRKLLRVGKNDLLIVEDQHAGDNKILRTSTLEQVDRRHLLNVLMKQFFYTASEEDFLTIRKGTKTSQIILGGEALPELKTANMVGDARYFLASELYPALKKSLRYLIYESMYQKSKVDADLVFGKGGMWWEDLYDQTVKKIAQIK